MIFRTEGKEYQEASAVEVVHAMERNAAGYTHPGGTLRQFLHWSLLRHDNRIPQRDLGLSRRISDEHLALSYLCLCDEYGVGELLLEPGNPRTCGSNAERDEIRGS